MTNREIVEAYLEAWNQKDFATARTYVADDFRFHGPIEQHDNADSFFKSVSKMLPVLNGLHLHGTAQDGEWVGSYYIFKTTIPGLEETPTSEWFHVQDGKIRASYLVFDASEWRPVLANMGIS